MSVRDYFARDLRIRHLRLLVAIDDAGQLTRAARDLHLTQPALSKTLTEIERSIGESLFERTPKGLVATRSGAALVRAARNTLDELDRASGEMQGLLASDAQTLVIGAMPTTALAFLGAATALLAQRNPSWVVRLVDGQMPALLPQLVAGRLHLVVGALIRTAVPEGVQSLHLVDDKLQLVVAAGHALAGAPSPSWRDCLAYPWVLPPPGNAIRVAFGNLLRLEGLAEPTRIVEALSADHVLALLESAQSLNLMPQRLATALEARGLVHVLGGDLAARLDISLPLKVFVPAGGSISPGTVAMIDCLREVLKLKRQRQTLV